MSTAPAAAGPPPLSEPARIINTFIAPGSTFSDIRQNQSWWVPWLLIAAMAVADFAVLGQKIGYEVAGPVLARVSSPGLARAAPTRSLSVWYGDALLTTNNSGELTR